MNDREFRAAIADARHWLKERQSVLQAGYPLAQSRCEGFDQTAGTITFAVEGGEDLVFGYVQIGSWSKAKHTFMWGWGNQTVDEARRADAERLRELAVATGCELFDRPVFVADPEMAQEMLALAARHLDVLGLYRVEQGELWIFLGLLNARTVPAE